MFKVVLIVLAAVVNELAAAQSESKSVDCPSFNVVDQMSGQSREVFGLLVPRPLPYSNFIPNVSMGHEPSCELFPNFRPRVGQGVNCGTLNWQGCVKMGYK